MNSYKGMRMTRKRDESQLRRAVVAACLDWDGEPASEDVVRTHYESCEKCQRAFADMLAELRAEQRAPSVHLSADVLATWDRDSGGLLGPPLALAKRHLVSCRLCQGSLEMLRSARNFAPAITLRPWYAGALERMRSWLEPPPTFAPRAALAMTAVLLVAAGLAVFGVLPIGLQHTPVPVAFAQDPIGYYRTASSEQILSGAEFAAEDRKLSIEEPSRLVAVRAAVSLARGATMGADRS